MAPSRPLSIAYVVSRFPALTETFVVREIDALSELGVDIDLYPLVVQRQSVMSESSKRWEARVRAHPWLSWDVARANSELALRAPLTTAVSAGALIAAHARSPRFLARGLALAPKSVAFGRDMRARGTRHIHAHFGTHAALSAMVAARAAGTTFSFTVHAYDLFLDRTFLASKVRAAAFVATISEYNRRLLSQIAPDAADRIHVIRCGPSPEALAVEARTSADERGPRILSVAQLSPYKGLRFLLEATSLLSSRLPNMSVTIVGDGEERELLETLRDRLGLRDTVHLLGAVRPEEVSAHLRDADIFVLPSIREANGNMDGIPVALMEAMAARVPVVASRLGGIPELVRDDDTGLLASPGDPQSIATCIERLWRAPELRGRLAAAARRHVESEFDVELNARRLLRLFEEAVR